VSVVPVNPAGVVVRCGGLMLRCERHGRGGDALQRLLRPVEDRGDTDCGLSGDVVSRVQLGDGCIFVCAWVVAHCLSLALAMRINCSWFEVESHCHVFW
jgi:hypothetical protein